MDCNQRSDDVFFFFLGFCTGKFAVTFAQNHREDVDPEAPEALFGRLGKGTLEQLFYQRRGKLSTRNFYLTLYQSPLSDGDAFYIIRQTLLRNCIHLLSL